MLDNRKIVVDNFCSSSNIKCNFQFISDATFNDFYDMPIEVGAIYIIGFDQYLKYSKHINKLVIDQTISVIFFNPQEGSSNMSWMYEKYKFNELIDTGAFGVVSGGDLPDEMPHFYYEGFLPTILDIDKNHKAISKFNEIYLKSNKPYKFLFLNGRGRPHRRYLINALGHQGVLDQSLWSNLDPSTGSHHPFELVNAPKSFSMPVKLLPPEYEVEEFQTSETVSQYTCIEEVKHHLFNKSWGDNHLNANAYIDTYFSLVTETVFNYPYSFRTEKTWKPIAMGHPFIIASNVGYYRDLKNIGFKTFGHLIDESFDTVDNNQDRIDRIILVVRDLCSQDLLSFLSAAEEICSYNQQHYLELAPQIRQEFPKRFTQFINTKIKPL